MKAILFSSFGYMAEHFLKKLEIDMNQHLKCLFVSYALEEDGYVNFSKRVLKKNFPNIDIVDLKNNYAFDEKIDVVFVNGGKVEDLIEKLLRFDQMDKLKKVISNCSVYIGESAGCVLFGNYSRSDLFTQFKREPDLTKQFGESAYDGLKIVDKMIVPHVSEYRLRRIDGDERVYRSLYGAKYQMVLDMIETLKRNNVDFETIGNNEALMINEKIEKLVYDWSNIPIIESELSKHEKELLEITKKEQKEF